MNRPCVQSHRNKALAALLLFAAGCAGISHVSQPGQPGVEITEWRRAQFETFDSLIPLAPDSIIALYGRIPPDEFHVRYRSLVGLASALIDSLNTTVDSLLTIDTLCIDHAVESFGEAGRSARTLYMSSSYFFLYNDPQIVRSLVTHEFGHIRYEMLDITSRTQFVELWGRVQEAALFYLFREGEYSGNARFGGHPEESPEELFASAFNLAHNRPDELRARSSYVSKNHLHLIESIIGIATR